MWCKRCARIHVIGPSFLQAPSPYRVTSKLFKMLMFVGVCKLAISAKMTDSQHISERHTQFQSMSALLAFSALVVFLAIGVGYLRLLILSAEHRCGVKKI